MFLLPLVRERERSKALVHELEEFGKPVDLVGHDWGGVFTARIALTRPDLVRSWVTDAIVICDDAFTWHDLARIWPTPGQGEAFMAQQAQMTDEQRTAALAAMGMSEHYARRVAGHDPLKSQCILDLYRSAISLYDDWFKDIAPAKKPGLALIASEDRYALPVSARAGAERVGIATATLDGLGHWWAVTAPKRAAEVLKDFWSSQR